MIEENGCQNVEALEVAYGRELPGAGAFVDASALDLIALPFGVRGVERLFGVPRLLPSVGATEQELGEISCWYVFASGDSASTKLLADANEQAQ
ncbi:MAG: hypothetical protein OXU63_18260 [Acidobacteriota bacterium]|nr:hypothetical protein [Acidobacteriota bacterium]